MYCFIRLIENLIVAYRILKLASFLGITETTNEYLNPIRSLRTLIFLYSLVLLLTHDKKQHYLLFLINEAWLNINKKRK